MITASKDEKSIILDARSYKRFTGEAKEPRPGLPSGHIPSSKSLPSSDFVNSQGFLKSLDEINLVFSEEFYPSTNNIAYPMISIFSGESCCV